MNPIFNNAVQIAIQNDVKNFDDLVRNPSIDVENAARFLESICSNALSTQGVSSKELDARIAICSKSIHFLGNKTQNPNIQDLQDRYLELLIHLNLNLVLKCEREDYEQEPYANPCKQRAEMKAIRYSSLGTLYKLGKNPDHQLASKCESAATAIRLSFKTNI